MAKRIVFLGSYMHCIFGIGDEIPKTGETVNGSQYIVDYSGKGSSQAMQATRMGSDVCYIGRLGNDMEGRVALQLFKESGLLHDEHIIIDEEHRTGIAIILADSHGDNAIMVIPGANDALTREDLDERTDIIAQADMMCFVFEANQAVSEYGIKKAHSLGVKTFLDPSPASPISEDVYPCLTYINPNEHEASLLTGISVTDAPSAVRAGRALLEKGVGNVIITMGGDGCVLVTPEESLYFNPPQVEVVDSTSAGDVFGGTLVAMLNQGSDLKEAIIYASCAGALATTAISPITEVLPRREAVEEKVKEYLQQPNQIVRIDSV